MSEKVGVVRSTSLEKDRVSVEENVGGPPKQLAYGGDDKLPPPPTLTAEEEKRLWRKIDMRILPILTLMYLCSFLDRGNIGNAKLQGLTTQLNLTGDKYNIALTMYFIPYCIFECPANFLLKKFRPSRWLPGITLLWGVIMTLMGLVKNYPQLVGTRVLLGVAEAGLFPGVVYYLSLWYPRHKLQYRIGLFYGGASLAGAFSGLLAFAISFMSGTAGLLGWSWIFILEGILTVIVGFVAFFVLVDFPHTATFLTLEERAWVVHRKKYDNSSVGEEEHFEYRHIRETLLDWQIWLHILLYMSIVAPGKLYGISLFLPFGFSTAISQLLTVPAYLLATIGVITCAYWSDKLQIRWPFVLAGLITCMVGFGINVANVPIGVKYFGTFLCVIGGYSSFPGIVAWLGNNLAGHYKRGLGMALHIGIGNFSGAIASNVYRSGDAPRYILGHSLEMMFVAIGLITLPIIVISYKRINAQRDAAMKEADERGIKYSPEELRRLGDRAPDFRYTI
ncbi:MFS general substrate transporter [Epithele typhae]|uniref:MFS general substrate transporter n=1 Tax=Epithele typhae TaxID=378194 RepID=UPI00200722F6|nr:MFS general substrate transporter [Epithele typhae]KAH9945336.1 MFS general substrate transporter [Epithele typhae]